MCVCFNVCTLFNTIQRDYGILNGKIAIIGLFTHSQLENFGLLNEDEKFRYRMHALNSIYRNKILHNYLIIF